MIRAYAMSVAWEQVSEWKREGFTAAEIADLIGVGSPDWRRVADRLAAMWLDLKQQQFISFARVAA